MQPSVDIPLDDDREHIELCDLLKLSGLADSGGAAKHAIGEGRVTVDGTIETRKRCKIRPGQVAAFEGRQVRVVRDPGTGPTLRRLNKVTTRAVHLM
jgi:ribosome-associated protein